MDTRIIHLIQFSFLVQSCIGVPLQLNFDDPIKEAANLKVIPDAEPPDVFSIVSTSNKDNPMFIHEGDIVVAIGRSALKCNGHKCRWSKDDTGTVKVPYTLSSDFRPADVSTIRSAMQDFSTLTCVQFTPWTIESDYLQIIAGSGKSLFDKGVIRDRPYKFSDLMLSNLIQIVHLCWSSLGKTGGKQQLSLGGGCVGRGTIQHELNHALGFIHEQSRSDRDDYVDIIQDNIKPGYQIDFRKYDSNNLGLEYDYSSVMHYGRYAFSGSKLPTIVPKPNASQPIGQRYGLSTLDIAKINKLYRCGVCRTLLVDSTGSLTSSNYPNNYPSNNNCLWLIRLPSKQIFLQSNAFDVESSPACASDYLRIYDGSSRSAPVLLDRACGAGQLPPVISTGNTMLLEFISDDRTEGTGFTASYSTVTCGAVLTSSKGSISSPNYPEYPPSMDCVWVITAPTGFVVSLNMTDFNLEYRSECIYDYLLVLDGPKTTSPLIGRYCGKSILPNITSSGSSLLLNLHSDATIQLKGFLAKYAFVPQK